MYRSPCMHPDSLLTHVTITLGLSYRDIFHIFLAHIILFAGVIIRAVLCVFMMYVQWTQTSRSLLIMKNSCVHEFTGLPANLSRFPKPSS